MPKRLPGRRGKHRMKRNWIKLSDKAGVVRRLEAVINDPEECCGGGDAWPSRPS